MKLTKTKYTLLLLVLVIAHIAIFSACEDRLPEDDASGFRSLVTGMDTNTACFLNIGYYPADLTEEGDDVFATTVDAYCSDGAAQNPKFVNRKYIRCNGEDMEIFYGDSKLVGRYGWSKETIGEPLNHLKIEMDYFDENYVFEYNMPPMIQLDDVPMPIVVDPEKGFELHYTGGGNGERMYVSIGYEGNGIGKYFTNDGSGVFKFTSEELKQLTVMFLEGEEQKIFLDDFEKKFGVNPEIEGYGFPINIQRYHTIKQEIKNGKNVFANIVQEDVDGFGLKLKK